MVEFQIPINKKQRVAYIPKVLVESLGNQVKIVPNTKAALMFRSDATQEEILHSIHIITEHFTGPKGSKK